MAISVRPNGVYWDVRDVDACQRLFSALASGDSTLVRVWCGELGISQEVAWQAYRCCQGRSWSGLKASMVTSAWARLRNGPPQGAPGGIL